MTEKEAKKIVRSIEKCSSYIFENYDYLVKVNRLLNGWSMLVWTFEDESTWNHNWIDYNTQKRVLEELRKLGFIDQAL